MPSLLGVKVTRACLIDDFSGHRTDRVPASTSVHGQRTTAQGSRAMANRMDTAPQRVHIISAKKTTTVAPSSIKESVDEALCHSHETRPFRSTGAVQAHVTSGQAVATPFPQLFSRHVPSRPARTQNHHRLATLLIAETLLPP